MRLLSDNANKISVHFLMRPFCKNIKENLRFAPFSIIIKITNQKIKLIVNCRKKKEKIFPHRESNPGRLRERQES